MIEKMLESLERLGLERLQREGCHHSEPHRAKRILRRKNGACLRGNARIPWNYMCTTEATLFILATALPKEA